MRIPPPTFVAGFIGSPPTNFLSEGALPALPPTTQLGIRPEHVALTAPGAGKLDATVLYAEALGAETLVHLDVPDGAQVTIRIGGKTTQPSEGSTVGLDWNDDHAMLFGPDGKRIPAR